MIKQSTPRAFVLPPRLQADFVNGLHRFFNGDSIETIRQDLDRLQNTTVTESYGDLDKDDKWLMMDFIRRMGNLIDLLEVVFWESAFAESASPATATHVSAASASATPASADMS